MGMTTKARTAPLDAAIADRLLDLLGTDDLFRERFQRDPLGTLRAIGYESPTPGQMTACGLASSTQPEPFAECKIQMLASKEDIAKARSEIRAMLTHGLAHTAPQLDATLVRSRLVRK
jgi:putative modified peptide